MFLFQKILNIRILNDVVMISDSDLETMSNPDIGSMSESDFVSTSEPDIKQTFVCNQPFHLNQISTKLAHRSGFYFSAG